MTDRQWKLNDDMHRDDAIFDEITFNDIILAAHCNEKVLDEKAIRKVAAEILHSRMQDFIDLLSNNIDEIIAEAMKGRN